LNEGKHAICRYLCDKLLDLSAGLLKQILSGRTIDNLHGVAIQDRERTLDPRPELYIAESRGQQEFMPHIQEDFTATSQFLLVSIFIQGNQKELILLA